MKKNKTYRRNNDHTHMSIYNIGKTIVYPTLTDNQIFEINQQIDILLEQLSIVANQRCDSAKYREEQLSKEAPITMNISLMYEELGRIYESIGRPIDALNALVMASQSLFERDCYILNSLMGKGENIHHRRKLKRPVVQDFPDCPGGTGDSGLSGLSGGSGASGRAGGQCGEMRGGRPGQDAGRSRAAGRPAGAKKKGAVTCSL